MKTLAWALNAGLGLVCLVALLALAASIPLINLFTLGYLMEVQGRVGRTGRIRSAFYLLPAARRLGGILLAVWLWLLPIQFLAAAAVDGWLLALGSAMTWLWTGVLAAASLLITIHLLMAIGCGGSLLRFVLPLSNMRRLLDHLRQGQYWQHAHDAISNFVAAFRFPHLVRMGLLGYITAYLWLAIPTILFTMLDDLTSRWQIGCFVVGGIALTLVLMWLPWLLAHVSAEDRWRAMFELAAVRKRAGQTPFCWAIGTAILLACSVVPLLYTALIKIRIPPHDARWDLMIVFLVTVAPARILVGWFYHRASRRTRISASWPWRIWQWTNGAALCVGAGYYVYFLNLASTAGELGRRGVWQFHAVLLPFPF